MEENTGTITLAEWAKEYHKKQQQQAQKTESKGKKIPKYTTRFKFDLYEKVMVRLGIITGLPIYIKNRYLQSSLHPDLLEDNWEEKVAKRREHEDKEISQALETASLELMQIGEEKEIVTNFLRLSFKMQCVIKKCLNLIYKMDNADEEKIKDELTVIGEKSPYWQNILEAIRKQLQDTDPNVKEEGKRLWKAICFPDKKLEEKFGQKEYWVEQYNKKYAKRLDSWYDTPFGHKTIDCFVPEEIIFFEYILEQMPSLIELDGKKKKLFKLLRAGYWEVLDLEVRKNILLMLNRILCLEKESATKLILTHTGDEEFNLEEVIFKLIHPEHYRIKKYLEEIEMMAKSIRKMDWDKTISLAYLEKSILKINQQVTDLYNQCFPPMDEEGFDQQMEFFAQEFFEELEKKKNQDREHMG
ncbi:hypothetical protein B5G26_00295 [Anaerotignum lactatifermentans]|uniref:Uncharacterized protein n=1 Tax=Anaerotignum lactatifermentans TaxID=160404 RepID=A0A1Y3UBP7_9FIRM|nr:hypothetical protein [Anaerotignum lactatifermentans]OUN45505.1 hypothetical protein B5G26_00295 [Anaerotignum lactatifermentans]